MPLLAMSDETTVAIMLQVCTLLGTLVVAYFNFRTSTDTAKLNIQAKAAADQSERVAAEVEKVAEHAAAQTQISKLANAETKEQFREMNGLLDGAVTLLFQKVAELQRKVADQSGTAGDIQAADKAEAELAAREIKDEQHAQGVEVAQEKKAQEKSEEKQA